MSNVSKSGKSDIPSYATFMISGLAACGAIVFIHPLDVVKNRMQLSGEGGAKRDHKTSGHAFVNIIKQEGLLSIYDGFSANIARQLCYTMTRFGVFQITKEKLKSKGYEGLKPQVASGLAAGLVASLLATPTDVALVRMTADKRLPVAQQRKYKHAIDALVRIGKEEGIPGLWTGVIPTVARALVGNVAQLVTYVQAKQFIRERDIVKDGIASHFLASLISGFVYAFSTNPLDVAKTRMQNMKKIDGKPEYSGMLDVWIKTVAKEGVTALWKGFTPYYVRIAPNTVLLFLFVEQLNHLYKVYILKDPEAKGGL